MLRLTKVHSRQMSDFQTLKFLLSVVVLEKRDLNPGERCALADAFLEVSNKAERQRTLRSLESKWFNHWSPELRVLIAVPKLSHEARRYISHKGAVFLKNGLGYFSPRAFQSIKKEQLGENFRFSYREEPVFQKHKSDFPPDKYVGVGYKDKGSIRDKTKDGEAHFGLTASQTKVMVYKKVILERRGDIVIKSRTDTRWIETVRRKPSVEAQRLKSRLSRDRDETLRRFNRSVLKFWKWRKGLDLLD